MTPRPFHRRVFAPAILAMGMFLAGCQADLYSGLTEKEANEMLAVLLANGIQAQKVPSGDEGITLQVDEEDLLIALDVLADEGFPRDTRQSLGQVFAKSGVMSSPFEERVRFMYGLGQEVSSTLAEIDGVLTARVHIVMPEEAELGQDVQPASAAVFLKHEADSNLVVSDHNIKEFVADAIEGLEYQNVTVLMTQAEKKESMVARAAAPPTENVLGVEVLRAHADQAWQVVYALAAALGLLVLAAIGMLVAMMRKVAAPKTTEIEVAGE